MGRMMVQRGVDEGTAKRCRHGAGSDRASHVPQMRVLARQMLDFYYSSTAPQESADTARPDPDLDPGTGTDTDVDTDAANTGPAAADTPTLDGARSPRVRSDGRSDVSDVLDVGARGDCGLPGAEHTLEHPLEHSLAQDVSLVANVRSLSVGAKAEGGEGRERGGEEEEEEEEEEDESWMVSEEVEKSNMETPTLQLPPLSGPHLQVCVLCCVGGG